jgi:ABC-type molybdenum transport system ATPase subunit/photorepair protein PhrA
MPSPEPVLELNEATMVKDDRRVLDGLTLTIAAGEHTASSAPTATTGE